MYNEQIAKEFLEETERVIQWLKQKMN